jgi:hypothetical protein
MQQRIYLPDSENEDDKGSKEGSLDSCPSSSSGIDDVVSIDDLRKMVASPSSLSKSSKQDRDISWKKLKRSK